jgi:hypothetical protein
VVTIARRYWWSDEDKRRFFRAWCANAQFAELGEGLGTGPDAAMATIYRWFAPGATAGAAKSAKILLCRRVTRQLGKSG